MTRLSTSPASLAMVGLNKNKAPQSLAGRLSSPAVIAKVGVDAIGREGRAMRVVRRAACA